MLKAQDEGLCRSDTTGCLVVRVVSHICQGEMIVAPCRGQLQSCGEQSNEEAEEPGTAEPGFASPRQQTPCAESSVFDAATQACLTGKALHSNHVKPLERTIGMLFSCQGPVDAKAGALSSLRRAGPTPAVEVHMVRSSGHEHLPN